MFDDAIRLGPDRALGLTGKFAVEHPSFVHHALGFYLLGSLAFSEGENGAYSWRNPSRKYGNFKSFAASYPLGKNNYMNRGISVSSLDALAEVRNAIAHNDGDLSQNRNAGALRIVQEAALPGVTILGTSLSLTHPFLEHVRVSTLAVRQYQDDG